MTIEINLPDIGIEKAEVMEILVRIGETIKFDQPIIVIEGDKISMEIPSPIDGIVKDIKISVGDQIKIGESIMIFEETNVNFKLLKKKTKKKSNSDYKKENVIIELKENKKISFFKFKKNKNREEKISIEKEDQIFFEIFCFFKKNSNVLRKTNNNTFSGIVKNIKININEEFNSGSLNIDFCIHKNSKKKLLNFNLKKNNCNFIKKKIENKFLANDPLIHATPIIRNLAREFGIDLKNIRGTGRKGRIIRNDIQSYLRKIFSRKENVNNKEISKQFSSFPSPKLNFSIFGNVKEIKLSAQQILLGNILYRNWITIPHVTQFDEIDITNLENFINKKNKELKKRNKLKITLTAFIIQSVSKALKKFPHFNSSLSLDKKKIILKKYININVAVDSLNKLFIIVVKDANKKNILEISSELVKMLKKAKENKLTNLDFQGGSFTISNLGNIGGKEFTPIINSSEVAILGISKSFVKPIWDGEKFVPRVMLPISLSYDHRIINGADSIRFINEIHFFMSKVEKLIL